MKYTPSTISTDDLPIAVKHAIGGEKRLWASRKPARLVGELDLVGDGSGVWTNDEIYAPSGAVSETGVDLVVKVEGSLLADAAAVVTVVGKDQSDALLSGVATFTPPSYARNKSYNFGAGTALDVTVTAGRKWKQIDAVSVTNAKKGALLKLFHLPDTADWQYIECVESVSPTIGTRPPVPIADGLDGAKDVVAGRSQPGNASINALHRSVVDGLQRFAGENCCLRMEVQKGGSLLVERHLFGNCILEVNPDFPDGNETAKQAANGMMAEYFGFYAL